MRIVLRARLPVLLLCGIAATAQGPRDAWKLKSFDLESRLTHSLADAPLTDSERAQIYRAIDAGTFHDSFTDADRDKERETAMSSRVGSIGLAESGSKQVLVRGPQLFCGAAGQCAIWIFVPTGVRQGEPARLVLESSGEIFIVRKTITKGLHDIVVGAHISAWDEVYREYRWDGATYKQVDCYETKFDRNEGGAGNTGVKPPVIVGCEDHVILVPGRPRA